MSFKNTVILFLVAVILFLFIITYDKNIPSSSNKVVGPLVDISFNEVIKVKLTNEKKEEITIEKIGEKWFITSPIKSFVEELTLNELFMDIVSIVPERVVKPNTILIKENEFKNKACLYLKNGKKIEIKVGPPTVLGASRYVKVDKKDLLYVVSDIIYHALQKGIDDLRSQKVFVIDQNTIDKFQMVLLNKTYIFEKDTKGWKIVYPTTQLVDKQKISQLIQSFYNIEPKKFINNNKKHSKILSLSPTYEITLWNTKTRKVDKLKIWKASSKLFYAQRMIDNAIFTINPLQIREIEEFQIEKYIKSKKVFTSKEENKEKKKKSLKKTSLSSTISSPKLKNKEKFSKPKKKGEIYHRRRRRR